MISQSINQNQNTNGHLQINTQTNTYQNKSCHSLRETGSWCSSFRTVGRIKGHLSSNCNWPCC